MESVATMLPTIISCTMKTIYYMDNSRTKMSRASTDIEEITIPVRIKEIDDYTFADCEKLTKIFIPDSVTEIGYLAFSGCKSLTVLSIPLRLTKINRALGHKGPDVTIYRRYSVDEYIGKTPATDLARTCTFCRIPTTTYFVNLCMTELFDIGLLSVLHLLEANSVDDAISIGTQLVCDYVPICDETVIECKVDDVSGKFASEWSIGRVSGFYMGLDGTFKEL